MDNILTIKQLKDASMCGDIECRNCALDNSKINESKILAKTALILYKMVKQCLIKGYCPICNSWINTGHSPNCELGNLIKQIEEDKLC